jgi:hypothetical protein
MPKSLDESLPFFAGSRDTPATSAVGGTGQERRCLIAGHFETRRMTFPSRQPQQNANLADIDVGFENKTTHLWPHTFCCGKVRAS